ERLAIFLGYAGRRAAAAIIDVAARVAAGGARHVAVIRSVAVVGTEIGARRKDADQHEVGSIAPERVVIVVRPEREAEDVAVEIRPEDGTGPAAPAAAPAMPSGAPELTAEAIPMLRVAERVAVEAGAIEIGQAVEIVRCELIVRELRVRYGRGADSACCG